MARQLFARAGTGKGPLHVNQIGQCFLVCVEPIGLKQHITIPCQFEPFKGFQNGINGTGYDPRTIEVIDAQVPFSSVHAGVQPRAYSGYQ
jgi:hypothetical protein